MKTLCSLLALAVMLTGLPLSAMAAEEENTADEYVSTADSTDPLVLEEDDRHSHVRAFPLVNHRRHGEDTRTKFVYLPGASVVKTRTSDDEKKVAVLDIPFFTLAESKSNANGEFDNKFIDLPIFGSLFRHKRQGNKEKVRFLIFSHTRPVDPDEYGDPKTHKPKPVRQNRGKGGSIHRAH
ncbi:MAG: hypothetical protein VCD00_00650 [Candidatus Hydrogenedentota bacterium]